MKKTLLILGGIALLCVLLIARLLFVQNSSMTEERAWFAKELQYEFSAQVDSVWMFNENAGRLRCLITSGDPQVHREDSLKKLFLSPQGVRLGTLRLVCTFNQTATEFTYLSE